MQYISISNEYTHWNFAQNVVLCFITYQWIFSHAYPHDFIRSVSDKVITFCVFFLVFCHTEVVSHSVELYPFVIRVGVGGPSVCPSDRLPLFFLAIYHTRLTLTRFTRQRQLLFTAGYKRTWVGGWWQRQQHQLQRSSYAATMPLLFFDPCG